MEGAGSHETALDCQQSSDQAEIGGPGWEGNSAESFCSPGERKGGVGLGEEQGELGSMTLPCSEPPILQTSWPGSGILTTATSCLFPGSLTPKLAS